MVISLGLIIYLQHKVNWETIYSSLKKTDIVFYILSTFCAFLTSYIVAWKYRLLIKEGPLAGISSLSLFKINLISRFYALFMPTAAAPVAVRWYKVTRNKDGRGFFLIATIFERLSFFFVAILFAATSFFVIKTSPLIAPILRKSFLIMFPCFFATCIGLAVFFIPSLIVWANSLLRYSISPNWLQKYPAIFFKNLELFKSKKQTLLMVLCISLLWQITFVVRVYFIFQSNAVELDFLSIAWLSSLVLMVQVLPISFSGIGLRESLYAFFFPFLGFSPESGVLIGILLSSQLLIISFFGYFFEVSEF